MKDIMRAMIDEALPAEGSAEVLRSHYREQFETSADLIYRNWCGAMMLQHGVESEIPSETGSLLEMCDRDSRFLRTIATLGCNGISFLTDADVAEACTSNSLTVDEFLGRAKSVENRCGFRFLNRLGEFTILSI